MTLKVMTWNLENLFRSGSAFGPKTKAIYKEKLDNLAAIINEEAPDALAVQEVGDPKALGDLVNRLDGTWHRHISKCPDGRGIRVAWLSPLTITDPEDIRPNPDGVEAGLRSHNFDVRPGGAPGHESPEVKAPDVPRRSVQPEG